MTKHLAIFDFDGTLTTKDTMFDFLNFSFGKPKVYAGLCVLVPSYVLFKCKLISRRQMKEHFLRFFFKDITIDQLNAYATRYAPEIDKILRPEAMQKLQWHKNQKHTIYIVSASVENWVRPWAEKNKIDLLATQLSTTGKTIDKVFGSENCYGQEKVNRIQQELGNLDGYEIYAYGDSGGDKAILALAQHKFYRCF